MQRTCVNGQYLGVKVDADALISNRKALKGDGETLKNDRAALNSNKEVLKGVENALKDDKKGLKCDGEELKDNGAIIMIIVLLYLYTFQSRYFV